MKKLLALTLFALLAISCSHANSSFPHSSKGSTMTYSVTTQAELDAANKRINDYKQELLRQGFREVSAPELVAALPNAPQVRRYDQQGWLPDEVAWCKDLIEDQTDD